MTSSISRISEQIASFLELLPILNHILASNRHFLTWQRPMRSRQRRVGVAFVGPRLASASGRPEGRPYIIAASRGDLLPCGKAARADTVATIAFRLTKCQDHLLCVRAAPPQALPDSSSLTLSQNCDISFSSSSVCCSGARRLPRPAGSAGNADESKTAVTDRRCKRPNRTTAAWPATVAERNCHSIRSFLDRVLLLLSGRE